MRYFQKKFSKHCFLLKELLNLFLNMENNFIVLKKKTFKNNFQTDSLFIYIVKTKS